jgi:hypothetical protein
MKTLKGQNGIARGCAAQMWRQRQENTRTFFGLHLQPSTKPSNNNLIAGFNTGVGTRTETLFSDYRNIS